MFHDALESNIGSLNHAILERIDVDYDCSLTIDPEVKQRWYAIGLYLSYDPVTDPAHTWISSMGRIKYLTPIYTALQQSGQHDLAQQWYDENSSFYHPLADVAIEGVLAAPIKPVKIVQEEEEDYVFAMEFDFDFEAMADELNDTVDEIHAYAEKWFDTMDMGFLN